MSIDTSTAIPAAPTLVAPKPGPTLSLIIDRVGFEAWLKTARPGGRIEYHRGLLSVDRQPKLNSSDNEKRSELHRLAARVLSAAEQGLVHLVQRRRGAEDFSYLAIKAGKIPHAAHATSCPRRAA